ncbi:MAG: hypothetical protein E6Q73_16750 [Pseudorhodobacter sp.]|nr:MAG: hypothetical protein E6Q73_16750 [Pseudorhodobacter sp.]
MFKPCLSASVLLAAASLLTACVQITPQPLPADYVPGADYNISADDCAAKGGAMTLDGNGLAFCSLPD